jgi:uncharacterized protein
VSGPRPPLAELLDLEAHPEGGWFRQTWRAPTSLTPPGYPGERATATAIHFVLGAGEESMWHRVRSDELWFWHRGTSLHLVLGGAGDDPEEGARPLVLGPGVEEGQVLQALVPGGVWQRARPVPDGEVLVSCVVSPGFEFADFATWPPAP